MLIAVIADPHANLQALEAVLDDIDSRAVDHIVCLGDLLGYNANPNEVVALVRQRRIPIVMGNHDAAVCGLEEPWFFRDVARKAIEWQIDELRKPNREFVMKAPEQLRFSGTCLAVHGSPSSRDEYVLDWVDAMRHMEHLVNNGVNACFFGHSHKPSFFSEHANGVDKPPKAGVVCLERGSRYLINPGSVGQPRDGDPRAAYGILDTDQATFEFCRVEYDVKEAMKEIVRMGLPKELAKRLRKGK